MTPLNNSTNYLDPRGEIHIPIGIADSLDGLKTFVEPEGVFSPGFASYGIYCWVYDRDEDILFSSTMDDVPLRYGLGAGGTLIPWVSWAAGAIQVKNELCATMIGVDAGYAHFAVSRVTLTNDNETTKTVSLYLALRALGPAGGAVPELEVSEDGMSLLVDGRLALISVAKPERAGVCAGDFIGEYARQGVMPELTHVFSEDNDCSGALRFSYQLPPGAEHTVEFICPVHPGRRIASHQWDGTSEWAQEDLAPLFPAEDGQLQPAPGVETYRHYPVSLIFSAVNMYWNAIAGQVKLELPDPRWGEAFTAIAAHIDMNLNEGAPDVSVINYNVYTRDGMYSANILQKSAQFEFAAQALNHMLAHPFSGRSYPEADNPGQILWTLNEQWQFTRDDTWLASVYPQVAQLAALITYLCTTPTPHWVQMNGLAFGDDLPEAERRELVPGCCDGTHFEYTDAFDIAGLRCAATLARATGHEGDADSWDSLANELFTQYHQKFAGELQQEYSNFCVLWPCRLYPFSSPEAQVQFGDIGVQQLTEWRYFPLATAHQGLLAGNRVAGYGTLELHLEHPQMRGWYAFDEGGKSGRGLWPQANTTWNPDVAMPHGWSIAEFFLLLRDCLVYEEDGALVLFAGVPEAWFSDPTGMIVSDLPTHYGKLTVSYMPTDSGASITLVGATPTNGYRLRLPGSIETSTLREENCDILLAADISECELEFL